MIALLLGGIHQLTRREIEGSLLISFMLIVWYIGYRGWVVIQIDREKESK